MQIDKLKQNKKQTFQSHSMQDGFTLLELLLVIAIIGILSTSAIINISIARAKARDVIRIKTFNQLTKGLEIYYSTHEVYPCGVDYDDDRGIGTIDKSSSAHGCDPMVSPHEDVAGFLNGHTDSEALNYCGAGPIGGLFSEGITTTNCPNDPLQTDDLQNPGLKYTYIYQVDTDRKSYVLTTYLETSSTIMAQDGGLCSNLYEVGNGTGIILPWGKGVGTSNDDCP